MHFFQLTVGWTAPAIVVGSISGEATIRPNQRPVLQINCRLLDEHATVKLSTPSRPPGYYHLLG